MGQEDFTVKPLVACSALKWLVISMQDHMAGQCLLSLEPLVTSGAEVLVSRVCLFMSCEGVLKQKSLLALVARM